MGQKIHPVGLRLGITRTWESRWYEKKNYRAWLHEDQSIRKFFAQKSRAAAISKVEIERRANQARVIVHTAKPGIIIGKRGVGIEDTRKTLERLTKKNVQVNVIEIKHPELDARLVGQNIVEQLEKRIAFRRAMKQAIMRTMKAGARGIKVMVSGRLGGSEIARSEQNHDGKVPLHTLRADIDYAHVEAFTTFGRIGCKVWIYKGEVLPEGTRPSAESRGGAERPMGERAQFRDRRNDRRGGRGRGGAGGAAPAGGAPRADGPSIAQIENDGQSLASEIDGAAPHAQHATSEHGGAATHDRDAQHGHGVTAETSVVEPSSQASHDAAERPGATAAPSEPASQPSASHESAAQSSTTSEPAPQSSAATESAPQGSASIESTPQSSASSEEASH